MVDQMPTYVPILAGCTFYEYGPDRYVLRTPTNRHFLVSATTRELLQDLGKNKSLEAICESISDESVSITVEQLQEVIEQRYRYLDILQCSMASPSSKPLNSGFLPNLTFLKCWELIAANHVSGVVRHLTFLYRWVPAVLAIALTIFTHVALYSRNAAMYRPIVIHGRPLLIISLSLLSVLAHELGHATALQRYDSKPGAIGFGLYLLMPTFFADVTQVWCLPAKGRYAVDLGGIYFQQIVFSFFALGAVYFSSFELASTCFAIDTMSLLALNPVFRFDGYWFLADWMGLPNLHKDALQYLRNGIRHVLRRHKTEPRNTMPVMSWFRSCIFLAYSILCNVFLAFAVVYAIRYLRSNITSVLQGVPISLGRLIFTLRTNDMLTAFDEATILLVKACFGLTTIFGLCLYFTRFVTYLKSKYHSRADLALERRSHS